MGAVVPGSYADPDIRGDRAKPLQPHPKTFISIDLETTGLEMDKHGICQIGAWATGESIDHFKDYFVTDVNPHKSAPLEETRVQISGQALEVNGFTLGRIEKGVPLWKALKDFNAWLCKYNNGTDVICVGQNVSFDLAWLKRDFYRQGLDTGIFRRYGDCYTLSLMAFGEPMGLGKVSTKLGLQFGAAHDALADAYQAAVVFHKLKAHLAKPWPEQKLSIGPQWWTSHTGYTQ